MNRFEESLHALKVEHKRVNTEICNERDNRLAEVRKLIVQMKDYGLSDQSEQTLRELLVMIRKDAERRLRKQHRTYVWRHREMAEQLSNL